MRTAFRLEAPRRSGLGLTHVAVGLRQPEVFPTTAGPGHRLGVRRFACSPSHGQSYNADMADHNFTVVIEMDEDGRFVAICPALQGCYTEGETEQEARELIEDAIRLHVQDRLAAGEPIHKEVAVSTVRVAV